jgi:Uma2 family endonuclease
MGMPATPTFWTVDMLDSLPDDGQRYEIIDGELFVTPAPAPRHQLVVLELLRAIASYLDGSVAAAVLLAPSDVRRGNQRHVQPDIYVLQLVDGKLPAYPFAISDMLLAIEINSPNTVRLDYRVKHDVYLEEGVGEYWVVNPEARNVTRWRQIDVTGEVLIREVRWQAPDLDKPLVIELPTMFTSALRREGPEQDL